MQFSLRGLLTITAFVAMFLLHVKWALGMYEPWQAMTMVLVLAGFTGAVLGLILSLLFRWFTLEGFCVLSLLGANATALMILSGWTLLGVA